MRGLRRLISTSLLLLLSASLVLAHEHHDEDVNNEENQSKPIDSLLWLHILLQLAAWGFMFPIGMVLGLTKSRFHVPLQVTAFALTIAGYVLGHSHGGRRFPHTVHGSLANIIVLLMIAQLTLGVYLKLHIHEKSLRPYGVIAHGILGKSWPVIGWSQLLFGAMTLRGYCMGDHVGQCAAHYIMGSAFIGYGVLLTIILYGGGEWVRRTGHSQEWFDSWVIMLWGIVNTFTEHHGSLTQWSHKDLQHTMLGVLWWTGGGLGIYLSRRGRRSLVPAIIIAMTGWAMSSHEQALMISTKVHGIFGFVLMSAGLARIIEIAVVTNYLPPEEVDVSIHDNVIQYPIRTLQYLTPFLLTVGGVLFMSATDEELEWIHSLEIDHVTYVLMMFSLAFIIYLYTVFLINLYSNSGTNVNRDSIGLNSPPSKPQSNGYALAPGRSTNERTVLHDSEAYELGDYDEDEQGTKERGGDDVSTPMIRLR